MSIYLPTVAWSTLANNVTITATPYRYYMDVLYLDPNEPGATAQTMAINDWFIDYAGYPFLIEGINGSTITVYDINERGNGTSSVYGPYANRLGYIYRPLNGAIILTQAQLRKLDSSAADIIQPIEKGVIYSQLLQLNQSNPQTVYGGIPIFSTGLETDFIDFDATPAGTPQQRRVMWNSTDDTIDIVQQNGVINQVGAELAPLYKNQTGSTIYNGTPVMVAGSVGASGRIKITHAIADGTYLPAYIVGVATEDIANGDDGHVTWFGYVRGIDTSGIPYGELWTDGDIVYVSATTPGYLTKTPPSPPNLIITVGIVVKAHAQNGLLGIRPTWRGKVQDLDDVNGTPLNTDGQILVWNNVNEYFDPTHNINDYLLSETAEDSGNPTGFINNSGITVSYNYTNRQITLTGDLSYYWKGTKKTLTSPWTSSAHTATLESWYLYSTDGDTFTWSQTRWSFYDIQVSFVNYSTSAASTFAIREVHGLMDIEGHIEAHDNIGTYRVSGGNATAGTYALDTDTDEAITPGFDVAIVKDEDVATSIPAWTQGTYSTMYVNSTTTSSTFSLSESFPFLYTPTSYITYNDITAGTLVTGAINRWFNVYQILIPTTSDSDSQKYRTIFLQPQVEHTSLLSATGEDVRGLNLGALLNLSPEFVFWARLTYYTNASYTTTGKVRLVSITYVTGNKANQITVSGFNPTNHAALSNLQWGLSGHMSAINYALPNFSSTGAATEVSPNTTTTRKYLSMLGDGVNGALPTWETVSGGGTPGGSNTYVQFNDGGSFGGDSGLVFNKSTDALTCLGAIASSNIETHATSQSSRLGLNSGFTENETAIRRGVYIGYYSGYYNSTGIDDTFVGAYSGYNTTGYRDVFIGSNAGRANTSGYENTYTGYNAGYGAGSSISKCIFIGAYSGTYETGSNKLFIDSLDRTDEATARISSPIYGVINATASSQELYLNSKLFVRHLSNASTPLGVFYNSTTKELSYGNAGSSKLASFYTDASTSGTTITNLYSYTIPADTLGTDGDVITAEYTLLSVSASGTYTITLGGNSHTSATLDWSSASPLQVKVTIIRVSNTEARVTIICNYASTFVNIHYYSWSGYTFSSTTDLILKATADTSTITAKSGYIVKL